MNEPPQIVTFYSYKGGVGRSMAVLNVAYAMAGRGLNVLVLDLDLEAPGLSGFLHRNNELGTRAPYDIVDLLRWASKVAQSPQPVDRAALPPASDYIVSVPIEKFTSEPELGGLGRLDVIPVDEARDYYSRMTGLGIGNLDRDALIRIGSVLRSWLKSRKFTASVPEYYGTAAPTPNYDFILVDSRTGVTEIGGLCIGPLSDNLVVLTALNDQNINGTKQFLEEVGVLESTRSGGRLDPKPTLIVASPVPAGEIETKKKRLETLRQAVGNIVVKLSYHPQLALFETIFVRDYQNEYLAKEYLELVELICNFGGETETLSELDNIVTLPKDEQRDRFRRLLGNVRQSRLFYLILQYGDIKDVSYDKEDIDYVLLDQAYRWCSRLNARSATTLTLKRAEMVSEWSGRTTDPDLRSLRFEAAQNAFSMVAESTDSLAYERAYALLRWGNSLYALGEHKTGDEVDCMLTLACEKYNAALRIKPDMHDALFNRGLALSQQARLKTRDEADRLLTLAGEDYDAALRIEPDNCKTLNEWGAALLEQAKLKTGDGAAHLFAQAHEKLLQSESLKPGYAAYDLACQTAIQGKLDECRNWLLKSLEHGELPSKQRLLEDADLENVRSLDWFQELLLKVG